MQDLKRHFAAAAFALACMVSPAAACDGGSCANGLAYEAFGPASGAVLAVFVHGDVSSGGPADYMYAPARQFAAAHKGVVAIALLRPGHFDRAGKRSSGSDNGRRDSFHSTANRSIAGAIEALKAKYGARKVIALGHSAGAGSLGVIAGSNAGLLSGIVLASCPCDVRAWDASRGRLRPSLSQSPIDFLAGVPKGASIVAVTGSADDNTGPDLAKAYVATAQEAGLSASARIVGGGHGFNSVSSASVSALAGMVR